ncbi:hypothetical protein CSA80_02890 [Candidatus Saccharibacteria bacterium]|nr:MAG: hypothetical protein CSA80_02890 [Candidatus Saccharibacteria bacterium]
MGKRIAILRGINVGGKRKILMADLKSICEQLGWRNVQTYIQSGNIIFDSDQEGSDLENKLEKAIINTYGFDVPVIVRTAGEIENSIRNNPFFSEDADVNQLHLTLLKEKPNKENIEKALTFNYEPDKFKIDDKDVFIFCAGKYHESKLTNNFFEKQLQVGATTRNWKTVLKLAELARREGAV